MQTFNRNIKTTLAVAALLLLAIATYLLINRQSHTTQNEITVVNNKHDPVRPIALEDSVIPLAASTVSSGTESAENDWPVGDEAAWAEVKKWLATRGWHKLQNYGGTDDYATYPKETLQKLGDEGDIQALHLLAERAPGKEYHRLLLKAAVHGSSLAFSQISIGILVDSGIKRDSTESERKRIVLEALSYIEVAKIRGDLLPYINDFESTKRRYNLEFTEEDMMYISSQAQKIYNDLEAQRIELGLGKFDNTVPPLVQSYFSYREKQEKH